MLEIQSQPDINTNIDRIYNLGKFDSATTFRYNELFKQIEENQAFRETHKKDLRKRLLRERITGKWGSGSDAGFSYLEHNAQTRGDLQDGNIIDLKYVVNVIRSCRSSAIWFQGVYSLAHYLKTLDCRKQWCPECGGKDGTIHKSRLHAILNRFDANKYNLRQFVFTIPDYYWILCQTKEKLNYLYKSAKEIIEKFFGVPIYDSKGHIKKYKLEKGALGYLHVFGETPGVFKPHINIHIIESKNCLLKLDAGILEAIKKAWVKKLRKIDETLEVADVHYSFRNTPKKVMHAIKYMSRPWSADDFNAIEDESLQRLLAIEMSGFQYLRFWGAISACKYKDEMDLTDIQKEAERKIDEPLQPLFIAPFSLKAWENELQEIDSGFYRVKKRGRDYEPGTAEKIRQAEKCKHC